MTKCSVIHVLIMCCDDAVQDWNGNIRTADRGYRSQNDRLELSAITVLTYTVSIPGMCLYWRLIIHWQQCDHTLTL